MSQEDAFLQAIIDEPDNDMHRLVYADWLEDRGDPRSELIRLQFELESLREDDPRRLELSNRERALLHAHQRNWFPVGYLSHWCYRRGFLDSVTMTTNDAILHADALFRRVPLRSLTLSPRGILNSADVHAFFRGTLLPRLHTINFRDNGDLLSLIEAMPDPLSWPGLESLSLSRINFPLVSRFLSRLEAPALRRLRLLECNMGASGVEEIARHTGLTQLQALSLGDNNLGAAGVQALVAYGPWHSLRKLDLENNRITPHGLATLAACRRLESLTEINLNHNEVGIRGLESLTRSRSLQNIHLLSLATCRLAAPSGRVLAQWKRLSELAWLDLEGNTLGSAGATALASVKSFPNLLYLDLTRNKIGDEGATALANLSFGSLNTLRLRANGLRVFGIKPLLDNPQMATLTKLDLSGNRIGGMGLQVIARSVHLSRLRTLSLHNNAIDAIGLNDLAAFTNLPHLAYLDLSDNDITDAGIAALLRSPLMQQLVELDLSENNLTAESAPLLRLLAESPNLHTLKLGGNELEPACRESLLSLFGSRLEV